MPSRLSIIRNTRHFHRLLDRVAAEQMAARFRLREGVLAFANERVVQLRFTATTAENGPVCLFAHPCVLSSW